MALASSLARFTETPVDHENTLLFQRIETALTQAGEIIVGKENEIRLAMTCLLAQGHILLEDLPGVGKTTLAHTLAQVLGLGYNRIQFTNDMLPADILGGSLYHSQLGSMEFQAGPIFTHVLLADEINRANARCQSALLEAMEECQVSIEGECRALPDPFFVIATQNPQQQIGTHALPESQLDRFHMRLSLGYPDHAAERSILAGPNKRRSLKSMPAVLSLDDIRRAQAAVEDIYVAEPILDYLQRILHFSRQSDYYQAGLSTRAGLVLKQCAQAWAFLQGRDHVLPEDVRAVLPHVTRHRLQANPDALGHSLETHGLETHSSEKYGKEKHGPEISRFKHQAADISSPLSFVAIP